MELNNRKCFIIAVISCFFVLNINYVKAQLPRTFNYQGVLKNNNGNSSNNGDYQFMFKLYTTPNSPNSIWSEEQTIAVENGIFNAIIGKVNPLPLDFSQQLYLGISVNGSAEMSPRIQLTSVPYSLFSNSVIDSSILSSSIKKGQVVKSINELHDDLRLIAGTNITIENDSNSIKVSAKNGVSASTPTTIPMIIVDSVNNSNILGLQIDSALIMLSNKGSGNGIISEGQIGLYGMATKNNKYSAGVVGEDFTGTITGYLGTKENAVSGFYESTNNYGVLGDKDYAVYGTNSVLTLAGLEKQSWGYIGSDSIGVYGAADVWNGIGIKGENTNMGHRGFLGSGDYGAGGIHNSGNFGYLGTNSYGVYGFSKAQFGIWGDSESGIGIKGKSKKSIGISGEGEEYVGVEGVSRDNYGVAGSNSASTNAAFLGGPDFALYAYNNNSGGTAIYAKSNGGYVARLEGDVQITGTLYKGAGAFRIDHPLDPEHKYLNHSFVESNDMMNVYNGNIILDNNGEATVTMPEWFDALNRDFRYQLTCIGGYAPVYIQKELINNSFKIAGGKPNLKVSWQVTGIRKDKFANENRIIVEEDKPVK